jgi:glutamyl-tRNA synthetase
LAHLDLSVVRARFAPSPTGYLHVGGARSALFNWLVVQKAKTQGKQAALILRIEDTNADRSDPGYAQAILEGLSWLGLAWDEGPYFQSQRRPRYEEAIAKLESLGAAYWCECTRDEIRERTKGRSAYDGYCRGRGLGEAPGRVLRFKVEQPDPVTFIDAIRGRVETPAGAIEDFPVAKAGKSPLFILANVVDDHDMGVTLVIRGDEHLANTPKGLLLWETLFDTPPPLFAHVPLIVDQSRKKLSKRTHSVAIEDYRREGFLPEAMVNYLALLGWGPKDQREKLTRLELVDRFELADVGKSPAVFDEAKLRHLNSLYIREMPDAEFLSAVTPFIEQLLGRPVQPSEALRLHPLGPPAKERSQTLLEAARLLVPVLEPPAPAEVAGQLGQLGLEAHLVGALLRGYRQALASTESWASEELHALARKVAEETGVSLSKGQAPLRVACTGSRVGLPLFVFLEALGKDETLRRIDAAIAAA